VRQRLAIDEPAGGDAKKINRRERETEKTDDDDDDLKKKRDRASVQCVMACAFQRVAIAVLTVV